MRSCLIHIFKALTKNIEALNNIDYDPSEVDCFDELK